MKDHEFDKMPLSALGKCIIEFGCRSEPKPITIIDVVTAFGCLKSEASQALTALRGGGSRVWAPLVARTDVLDEIVIPMESPARAMFAARRYVAPKPAKPAKDAP